LILCKWIARIFALCWLFALALLLIGTFGLFGQPRDPLSGIFLLPLGMPWLIWLDDLPDPLLPWAGALAPLINLVLIALACRLIRRAGIGPNQT
jgi:hypothetical protein